MDHRPMFTGVTDDATIWHGPFRALSLPPSWDDYNKQNADPLSDRANEWLKRPLLKAKGHQVVKICAQEMSVEDTVSTSASDSPRRILGGSAQEHNITIDPSTLVGHPTKRRRISTQEVCCRARRLFAVANDNVSQSVPTAKDMSLFELFDKFELPARTFADTLAREGKYGACIACGNMILLKSHMPDMLTHLVGKGRVNCRVFKLLGIQYQGRAGPATIGWYFKDFERFAVWTLKRHPELVEVLKDGSYKYPQMTVTSFLRQDAKEWWAGQPQLHNLKGQELTNALDVLAQGITLQVAI
ncbi:hypothetical protein BKA62DRAFT_111078 [Auriculariales sp. MPI-PUGE-AT-0066]|nr:hypothetical protein BKA62DRAFT_111078 [Auriculariales sp. MPI-PUGE-AT-0066]